MAARQLSDGDDAGTVLGQSASDLIGFHGQSPCDQAAYVASIITSIISVTSGGFAFGTSDKANELIAAVNSILLCLREKGLMASS